MRTETGVDAPFRVEAFGIDGAALTAFRQIGCDVEADPACPDDRDALPHRLMIPQYLKIREHTRVVDAFYRGGLGDDSGRQHHVIKFRRLELGGGDAAIQSQRYAGDLDPSPEVTERFRELFLAGDLLGQIELPSDFGVRLEQGYVVAARRRGRGRRQPGGARTDDRDAASAFGRAKNDLGLVTGDRIDEA